MLQSWHRKISLLEENFRGRKTGSSRHGDAGTGNSPFSFKQ